MDLLARTAVVEVADFSIAGLNTQGWPPAPLRHGNLPEHKRMTSWTQNHRPMLPFRFLINNLPESKG
jgi:hypothetical protein